MRTRGLDGGPSKPHALEGFFFAENNAEVAVAPLTPSRGSKPRAQAFFPQPASLGALALALAGVGVLTGTVLVVRLIALPSGKPSSVLSTPNAGLGGAIYGTV
jgi:hypothetical protein